jgi:glutamyl-tRNA reductase
VGQISSEDFSDLAPAMSVYHGIEAYTYLLSVATGLASQVVGETDIFGQFKEAWKNQEKTLAPELKKELSPWMQRLFEDTKEVRSLYLQNVGGSSYGSLVRKLLRDYQALDRGPTLLVGAGQLAQSVAPYLMDHQLMIANRTVEKARELSQELLSLEPTANIRVLNSFEEELQALPQAAQVIICVPADSESDQKRIEALAQSGAQVVHLGARAGECAQWFNLKGFHSLDEIFEIEKSLSSLRSLQVERAKNACHQKARLRALGGGSTSISHGWEDLAAFGS